jgi:hypothetical protein
VIPTFQRLNLANNASFEVDCGRPQDGLFVVKTLGSKPQTLIQLSPLSKDANTRRNVLAFDNIRSCAFAFCCAHKAVAWSDVRNVSTELQSCEFYPQIHRCEDGRFPVSTSRVTNSNPDSLSSCGTQVNLDTRR